MEEDFKAGYASAIGGIATNYVIYIFFTILGILSEDPFFEKFMNTDFVRWFITVLVVVLLVEVLVDFVNAIASISYAIGLIIGGFIVLVFFGEMTNVAIGLFGFFFRIVLEILKEYGSYSY